MKIIITAEHDCIAGIPVRRPAVVKIGEVILTSMIPRSEAERDTINNALEEFEERFNAALIGAMQGYGG